MAMNKIISRGGGASLSRLSHLSGKSTRSLKVNHRTVTSSFAKSGTNFPNSQAVSERLEMRRLQSKLNTGLYDGNEVAKRRIQNKVAASASNVYGLDKSKLTRAWRGTGGDGFASQVRQVDSGKGADLLENKVNTPFKLRK